METLIEEFDENDVGSLKVPKVRSLLPARKYRDSVKKWGEPSIQRRRVHIVPSIKCAARDLNVNSQQWSTTGQTSSNAETGMRPGGSLGKYGQVMTTTITPKHEHVLITDDRQQGCH